MRAENLKELMGDLVDWRPEGGVVSVYFEIDPADRSEGWRTELREQLSHVPEAAAKRVLDRFPANAPLPEGRSQIGFLEVDGEREIFQGTQITGLETQAYFGDRAHLAPLVQLLDDAWPIGVVLVALENVRVLEWALGRTEELVGWELEITSLDWRERKAPVSSGSGTSASGRDQYSQRLDHNRERFLKQAGELVTRHYGDRPWRQIVVVGEGDRAKFFTRGLNHRWPVHEIHQDLIRLSAADVGDRIEEQLEHLNRTREEALLHRLEEAIGSAAGAALGPDQVLESLAAGRARHVLFDSEHQWPERDSEALREQLIEGAIATSAEVTPVEGLAAAGLREHDGAAALLRY